jgi:hypothetical protein
MRKKNNYAYQFVHESECPAHSQSKRSPLWLAMKAFKDQPEGIALKFPTHGQGPEKARKRAHSYAERLGFYIRVTNDKDFIYVRRSPKLGRIR